MVENRGLSTLLEPTEVGLVLVGWDFQRITFGSSGIAKLAADVLVLTSKPRKLGTMDYSFLRNRNVKLDPAIYSVRIWPATKLD